MALQKQYEDASGNVYPESYWRITGVDINVLGLYANFIFSGYKDQSARNDGKRPIHSIRFSISGEEFTTAYTQAMAKEKNLAELGYALCKDKPSPETIMTGNNQTAFFPSDSVVDV